MKTRKAWILSAFMLAACGSRDQATAPTSGLISMEVRIGQNDTSYTDSVIPLQIHITTEGGVDDANQLVNWVVTSGTGTLFVAATISGSNGVTGNRLTLGAGDNTIEARAIDSNGNALTFAVIHAYGLQQPRIVDWRAYWNDTLITSPPQVALTPGVPFDVSQHLVFKIIDTTTGVPIPGATTPIADVALEPFNPGLGGSCTFSGTSITCNAAALDGSHILVFPKDPGPKYQWISYRGSGPARFVNSTYFQVTSAVPTEFAANFTYSCNARHSCSFDASSSTIPNGLGTLGSYNWSFGDGYQGTKVTITHDYSGTRTVNVTLKIYDSKLKSMSITKTIITNIAPIVFTSDRGGNTDIYTMNADGTNQLRLTTDPSTDYQTAISPDRTKIAFVSNRTGDPSIYVMNSDGSNQTQLTSGSVNYVPEWSPDGKKLVFISERDGGGASAREVYTMDASGSNQTRLTSNSSLEGFPSYSPDGTHIVFESMRDGPNSLYTMYADGSFPSRLTSTNFNEYQPSYSPDGQHIAFVSDRDGNLEIYVMAADGGGQKRVTMNAAADSKPSWSPDGSKIAFSSDRGTSVDIYVMKADGSGVVQLTTNPSSEAEANFPLH